MSQGVLLNTCLSFHIPDHIATFEMLPVFMHLWDYLQYLKLFLEFIKIIYILELSTKLEEKDLLPKIIFRILSGH